MKLLFKMDSPLTAYILIVQGRCVRLNSQSSCVFNISTILAVYVTFSIRNLFNNKFELIIIIAKSNYLRITEYMTTTKCI